ncbi:UBX domain-containing protein 5 [Cyphellophora attinorum]|uniref:UBX domain-containing protein 5 n=1 Tax=Cyphellophora attinorum TaxID=1664694 RepID=A0A0N1P1W9_9EURO|nr:UBX domain-containing protein 5 [Phialophora attinorum]KPI45565.1 UBX domain-containing protein 5 [Phialophora attinorum]
MADDVIAGVVSITGCTPEIARQYVQLGEGDTSQAIQLFYENGGADLSTGSSATPPVPTASRPSNANNPITIDDDDDLPTGANVEDDEAMARRLQEEMYGAQGSGQEQDVRAPIARRTETLAGPGSDMMAEEYEDAMTARLQAMHQRAARGQRGIFNQRETSDIWNQNSGTNDLAAATGGRSEQSAHSNMLARLFQPPWDLMYGGSWEEARDEGKEQKKWILINIQDGSIFDCQALNRDLWKNDQVTETIKENFIFIQYSKDDPRADQYNSFYFQDHQNPDQYPHVAIVDPRTGEQIKLWSRKIPTPAEFLMQLHEFLDRYSLDNNARNPVAKRKSETPKQKSFDEMTEDEQLEHALQASMAAGAAEQPPTREDPDDLTRSVGDLRKPEDPMDVEENGSAEKAATPFSLIPSDRPHTEPAAGPGVTRVQIRHSGGRIVRRFAENDPVQTIYEYLKAEPVEGKAGLEFELISMNKNLMEQRGETIESAGLKNGTVMVEYLDGADD